MAPVSGVVDVSGRANIAGAGINIAQRVMDCGDAGHILLSKHVAEDLEQLGHWKKHLHDLGEAEVKHGAHVSVVNLYTEELGNPEVPQKFLQARHKAAMPAFGEKRKPRHEAGLSLPPPIIVAALALGGYSCPGVRRRSPIPVLHPQSLLLLLPLLLSTLRPLFRKEHRRSAGGQFRARRLPALARARGGRDRRARLGLRSQLAGGGDLLCDPLGGLRAARPEVTRHPEEEDAGPSALNRRGHALVGRVFTLETPIVEGSGRIRVDDSSWRVTGPSAPAGAQVRVVRADGATLVVEQA